MTKPLLPIVGTKKHVSLVDIIYIFAVIGYCTYNLYGMTIFVYLSMHVFSYDISRGLCDLIIR